MNIPLLDLRRQYQDIKEEILKAIAEVCESQRFILGPNVERLEKEIATYCNSRYAVGVSSGTDALLITFMCEGIGKDDLVITSPYTFFATVGSIIRVGANPIFVDIDPNSYNIDPYLIELKIKEINNGPNRGKIKAIVPIHLFGQCAEMDHIMDIAKRYGLIVIEDAAQALGAEYRSKEGEIQKAGSIGDYGCFSFFPSKNLGGFGDGGIVITNDQERYELLKILRVHGAKPKYFHKLVGGNFRLDEIQASILLVKLRYLDTWIDKRIKNASIYRELIEKEGLEEFIDTPHENSHRHTYNQFIIRLKDPNKRDPLRKFLSENGVGTEIYYPIPIHLQDCLSYLNYKEDDFPVSLRASKSTLALPIYPELRPEEIEYIVSLINRFFKS